MMLDAILPAVANLPRAGLTQSGAQPVQPVNGERPAFAQLLLQAGTQISGEAVTALQHEWLAEGDAGNRTLLAQMIAEHNGSKAAAALSPESLDPNPEIVAAAQADLLAMTPTASVDTVQQHSGEIEQTELPVDEDAQNLMAAPIVAPNEPTDPDSGRGRQAAVESQPAAANRPELTQKLAAQAGDKAGAGEPPRFEAPASVSATAPDTPVPQQPTAPLQTTTPAAATAAAAQAQAPALTAPVATPEWNQQLGQQVAIAVRGDEQRVTMNLNPANLGPLQVELKIVDQQAQLQFLSSHGQVRGAVEQAIPQLREALAEQGITLGETSVGEQREGQQHAASSGQYATGGTDASEQPEDDTAATVQTTQLPADGRVNVYV